MREDAENQVFQVLRRGVPSLVRVLWTSKRLGKVFYVDLPARLPLWMPLAEFERGSATGSIVSVDKDPYLPPALGDGFLRRPNKSSDLWLVKDRVTGNMVKRVSGNMLAAMRRYDAIAPLVFDEARGMLFKERRGSLLASRAAEAGVSRTFLYDSCKLWWTHGPNLASLGTSYWKCGAPGKSRIWTRPPGPVPSGRSPVNPLDAHMRAAFDSGVDHLRKNPSLPMDAAYGKLLREHYPEPGSGEALRAEPRFEQFANYVRTHFPATERLRKKTDSRTFAKDHAPHFGTTSGRAFGPGSYYEIDGTWGEHELVSQINRAWKMGKPTIYLVVDIFSGVIVGFHVSLRNFNKSGAAAALASAFTPKDRLAASLGLPSEIAKGWHYGVGHGLISDRGKDVLSDMVQRCAGFHRVGLENVSPGRGDEKAKVENRNSELKPLIREALPGLTAERDSDKRPTEPGATLREYTFAVAVACHILNSTRRMENCPPEARGPNGEAPTRNELFAWGLVNRSGPKFAGEEQIRLSMATRVRVRESQAGFCFGEHLRYKPVPGCPPLPGIDFVHREGKVWAKREMILDEEDITQGWIVDRFGKPCCPVTLCGSETELGPGLSLSEYKEYRLLTARGKEKHRNADARKRAEGRDSIRQIGDAAKEATRADREVGARPGPGRASWLGRVAEGADLAFVPPPPERARGASNPKKGSFDFEASIAAAISGRTGT